jgi:hypothetical protein
MSRAVHLVSVIVGAAIALQYVDVLAAPTPDKVDTEQLRADLVAQRKVNLERFHAYRVARVYPHNSYEPGVLNVWRDADGHLCAVATMMSRGGLDELVDHTATSDNNVRLVNVTTGPLADWVLTSGLTQEELVMIQQPSAEDIEMEMARERREARKLKKLMRKEDDRLESNYIVVERTLKNQVSAKAGLDLAVARLASRPDLAKALHEQVEQRAAEKSSKPTKKRG